MNLRQNDWILMGVLLILASIFIFWRLEAMQISDWDEGIYASISGQQAREGISLKMDLQGLQWFEKEPLGIWILAVSQKTFGFNEFAVRMPSAIFSIFVPLLIFLIATNWMSRMWSFFTSLFFLFSPIFWDPHVARTGDFDMIFLSLFLLSIYSWLKFRERNLWYLPAIILSIAFSIRGLFAFLPLVLILFFEYIWFGQIQSRKFNFKKAMIFIALAVAPWVLWQMYNIALFGTDFINIYWLEQTFGRFSQAIQGHSGDFTYYIDYWLLRLGMVFWIGSLGVIFMLYRLIIKRDFKSFFLFFWFLITFLPIMLMKTKLYWYSLPALPPFFLLGGAMSQEIYERFHKRGIDSGAKFGNKIIFPILGALLMIQVIFWARALSIGIVNIKKSDLQNITNIMQSSATLNKTSVILYKTKGWNFGRVLPSVYWYLKFKADTEPIHIETQENRDHYLVNGQNELWIIDPSSYQELKESAKISDESLIYKGEELILVKIPHK